MHTAGRQAQHHVAGLHIFAGEDQGLFHHAHRKTRQVVFASGVHAGHLGGFAANQRTARQLTTLGNAAHHRRGGVHIQLAAGKVIEEKQRFRALHQHIVDAHGHQINAHGVVHIPFKSQLKFGAHAIGAADQDRFFVVFRYFKQCAKAANTRQHALAHGFFGQGFDAFDQRITSVNVNASVFVGKGSVHE